MKQQIVTTLIELYKEYERNNPPDSLYNFMYWLKANQDRLEGFPDTSNVVVEPETLKPHYENHEKEI